MSTGWSEATRGLFTLPSGRAVRGRGLRHGLPTGQRPTYGVYLLGRRPPPVDWETDWIRWPDFWLPTDRSAARAALQETWRRAEHERVEVACGGGIGRTGTALACLAVMDGVPPTEAVDYVRTHYHPKAVETPWQRRYVHRFG